MKSNFVFKKFLVFKKFNFLMKMKWNTHKIIHMLQSLYMNYFIC